MNNSSLKPLLQAAQASTGSRVPAPYLKMWWEIVFGESWANRLLEAFPCEGDDCRNALNDFVMASQWVSFRILKFEV